MGIETDIEWCDSTVNGQMGCDGCELWNAQREDCYAGQLTRRYAGLKGWPESFDAPTLFPDRIPKACKWPDLTGTKRPIKRWLDGYPRLIFLDDMGDTFTESLPRDWLLPYIPAMESSPHTWQFLTKRPERMRRFFVDDLGYVPRNFWLGTSVTGPATRKRIWDLLKIPGAPVYFVSYEPAWKGLDIADYIVGQRRLSWVIVGGQSGPGAEPMHPDWARSVRNQCSVAGTSFFFKQWGAWQPVSFEEGHWPESSSRYTFEDRQQMLLAGKKAAGRLLDGREWNEMPTKT